MKGVAQTTAPLTPLAQQADVTGAQTPGAKAAALEFEEASIRPCDPDNLPTAVPGGVAVAARTAVYMTPGRLYALCMTPATLIRTAYGYCSVAQEVELGRLVNPEAPGRHARPLQPARCTTESPPKTASAFAEGQTGCAPRGTRSRRLRGSGDRQNDVCAPLSIGGRTVPTTPERAL